MININKELLENQDALIKNLETQIELLHGIIETQEKLLALKDKQISNLSS